MFDWLIIFVLFNLLFDFLHDLNICSLNSMVVEHVVENSRTQ